MPKAPNQTDLKYADAEIDDIQSLLSPYFQIKVSNPTTAAVLEMLPSNEIIRLACHGVSSETDPSESALLLSDLPLTVSELESLKIEFPQLAYLSACHTAVTRDLRLNVIIYGYK